MTHVSISSSEFAPDILQAVQREGRWVNDAERRISTVTEISRVAASERRRHRVRLCCDYEPEAERPTLTRAIEIADAYERTIVRLFHDVGWPAWASRMEVQP